MSANVGYATLNIIPSAKGFGKALSGEIDPALGASGKAGGSKLGSTLAKVAGPLFALAGTAAMGAFITSAVSKAGDLEQSMGAIETVFKGGSAQMLQWSKDAAISAGLSRNEYNELGTLIGSQLKNAGTAMEDLGPKTNGLITLGADLSSMFGGTTREAVEALSSALKGERDPIERYGVSLNQARIDAKAAELGFKKVGGTLSGEANAAATLALIMEQTNDAHGNFAKESSTYQGTLQRLKASWENVSTVIGQAFLPFASMAASVLLNMMPTVQAVADTFQTWGTNAATAFAEAGGGLPGLQAAFGSLLGSATGLGGGFGELIGKVMGVAAQLSPLGILFQALLPVLPQLVAAILPLASALGTALAGVLPALIPLINALAAGVAAVIPHVANFATGVVEVATALVGWISANSSWLSALGVAAGVVGGIVLAVKAFRTAQLLLTAATYGTQGAMLLTGNAAKIYAAGLAVVNNVQKIATGIQTAFNAALRANPIGIVITAISALVAGLIYFFTQTETGRAIWSAFMTFLSEAWANIVAFAETTWGVLSTFFSELWTNVSGFFTDIWTAISTFVTGLWDGMVSTVTAVFTPVADFFSGLWDAVSTIFSTAWDGIVKVLTAVYKFIETLVRTYIDIWRGIFLIFAAVLKVIWDGIVSVVKTVWNAIVAFVTPIVEGIARFIRETFENVRRVWETIWNAIKSFFSTIWNGIKAVVTTILQAVADYVRDRVEAIKYLWETVWGAIKSFFTTIWNAIKDFLTPIINGIRTTITNVVNAVKATWDTVWNAIKTVFSTVWNGIKSFLTPIIEGIRTTITNVVNGIKSTWERIWNGIKTFFTDIWNGIKNAVTDKVKEVANVVGGIKDKVMGALKGIGSWLKSAGGDLIRGLWNGIKDIGGWLHGKIKGFFDGAVGWAKDILGIHSPSRRFAELGVYVGQGFGNGIDSMAGQVAASARGLGQAAIDAVDGMPDLAIGAHLNGSAKVSAAVADARSSYGSGAGTSQHLTYTQVGGQGLTSEQELVKAARRLRHNP